jgi:hypothetical protein
MTEIRVFPEGSLRWAQASGSGLSWATASAPLTALIGFVEPGLSVTSARDVLAVYERGKPSHHKMMQENMPEVTFTYKQAVSGNMPPMFSTASGASVPMTHFELKHDVDEQPGSAEWFQFIGGVCLNNGYTEPADGNRFQQTWRFLTYTGPTASGYLSTAGQ